MKFFAIFATLLAVTCAYPKQWSLHELSEALQDPNTDPAMVPYLQAALNELMMDIWGQPQPAPVVTPTDVSSMTLHELSEALQNPNTDPAMMPLLEAALNDMMNEIIGQHQPSPVATPVEELSMTLPELSAALQDPNTDPALVPYLEQALNTMMDNLMAGNQQESIIVAFPVGLLPAIETPAPVVTPTPVETPVAPTSGPLVQIIVNIKQQEVALAPVVNPAPVVTPNPAEDSSPVEWMPPVRPEPEQSFIPVNPVDVIAITPPESINPVDAVPITPVNPIAITPVNPVDVIAVIPPQINPVDVIAVAAPEVNPIDVASPIPVVPIGVAGVVGPIL